MTDAVRGSSASTMRVFECKDCRREIGEIQRELEATRAARQDPRPVLKRLRAKHEEAQYNENWATRLIERGGTRSDRCLAHRQKHRGNIQGMAVAYIDLRTVGEVTDPSNPTGALGGLGPLPGAHRIVPNTTYDLQRVPVGMTDDQVTEIISSLRTRRVLVLKAGTGTGKSTFVPYRLLDPPAASLTETLPFNRLAELGQIVVTEPRRQAAIGVATFVGEVMSGAGGVGPGYPVGYQVSQDRNHDDACQLVYVTDGTMINWLRDGRLSRIGTVIIDEAHERNTNIDFIMAYLRRELHRHPHLRVIITSATFDTDFYLEYFGGPEVAAVIDVPPMKAFGYGMPLFGDLDSPIPKEAATVTPETWPETQLPLAANAGTNPDEFVRRHWPEQFAPPYTAAEVKNRADIGKQEDVWKVTKALLPLRNRAVIAPENWRTEMPQLLTNFVVTLAEGLDDAGIHGDILAFLPTGRTIDGACEEIERRLGSTYRGEVFPLISTLSADRQRAALAPRRKGEPRKIVISTNLAETSLTVEGVRFVVDSGLIAQSEWDPAIAQQSIPTKAHSRAGIKQRWGRVGRKGPGWVFPLYTMGQYQALAADTPPASTRENLEALVMTAKLGGIDDVVSLEWPASFEPQTVELDHSARQSRSTFLIELARAHDSLTTSGAVDADGHPTSFGRELARFASTVSPLSAIAILYADRLGCVPEVATITTLLEDTRLTGQRNLLLDDFLWPDEWRLEATDRHRGLASLCSDEADLALTIMAAWERADPRLPSWKPSALRRAWARAWWVSDEVLLSAAEKRREILDLLSPAMKDEATRFVTPALAERAAGAITRAFSAHVYQPTGGGFRSQETADPESLPFGILPRAIFAAPTGPVVSLSRRITPDGKFLSNLVIPRDWALAERSTPATDALRLLQAAADHARPRPSTEVGLHLLESWPVGQRMRLEFSDDDGVLRVDSVSETVAAFSLPEASTTPHAGRRRRRARVDAGEASRSDIDVDLAWGATPSDRGDEDALAHTAFAAADLAATRDVACGVCNACVQGREIECTDPAKAAGGRAEDRLQSWFDRARASVDVTRPRVLGVTDDLAGEWFEVVGYAIGDDDSPTVLLRRDWRTPGSSSNPADHVGIAPGDPIEVVVGPLALDHGGALRVFWRVDGFGRFVLREASNRRGAVQVSRREIALGLDRGTKGLVDDLVPGSSLTATVVPARVDGCYTITLLELLHQHLEKARAGRTVIAFRRTRGRNAEQTNLHVATVELGRDPYGYAHLALRHRDSARGVIHRFRMALEAPSDEEEADDAATPLENGLFVGLNLKRDRAELDVADLDLAALAEIELESDGHLALVNPRDRRSRDELTTYTTETGVGPDQPLYVAAPPGTMLRSESEGPVSRAAAIALVELDATPEWRNEVWSFWARSHHRRVDRAMPFQRSEATEIDDVPADVVIATRTARGTRLERLREFEVAHPPGSVVECLVNSTTDEHAVVTVEGSRGRIARDELAWVEHRHPSDSVSPGDTLLAVVLSIDAELGGIELSHKRVTPDPFVDFCDKHAIGDRITGLVVGVIEWGAFVELAPDVDGFVHISELDLGRVENTSDIVTEGQTVTVAILSVDTELRRIGLSIKRALPEAKVALGPRVLSMLWDDRQPDRPNLGRLIGLLGKVRTDLDDGVLTFRSSATDPTAPGQAVDVVQALEAGSVASFEVAYMPTGVALGEAFGQCPAICRFVLDMIPDAQGRERRRITAHVLTTGTHEADAFARFIRIYPRAVQLTSVYVPGDIAGQTRAFNAAQDVRRRGGEGGARLLFDRSLAVRNHLLLEGITEHEGVARLRAGGFTVTTGSVVTDPRIRRTR